MSVTLNMGGAIKGDGTLTFNAASTITKDHILAPVVLSDVANTVKLPAGGEAPIGVIITFESYTSQGQEPRVGVLTRYAVKVKTTGTVKVGDKVVCSETAGAFRAYASADAAKAGDGFALPYVAEVVGTDEAVIVKA